jgi:hypothetical protein
MENGRVNVDQQNRQYEFEIKNAKVFATSNEISRFSKPLHPRFRRLHLPRYTKEQFLNVAIKVCPKLSEKMAAMIAEQVWAQSRDIREVISVSKLIRKNDDLDEIKHVAVTLGIGKCNKKRKHII